MKYTLIKNFIITSEDLEKIFSNQKVKLLYEDLLEQLYSNNEFSDLYQSALDAYNKSLMSLESPFPYTMEQIEEIVKVILRLQIIGMAFDEILLEDTNIFESITNKLREESEQIWDFTIRNYANHIKELVNPNRIFKK